MGKKAVTESRGRNRDGSLFCESWLALPASKNDIFKRGCFFDDVGGCFCVGRPNPDAHRIRW